MKKKILSLALALALCLGLTVPAFADTEITGTEGKITYRWLPVTGTFLERSGLFDDRYAVTVVKQADQDITTANILSSWDGEKVEAILGNAFANCNKLTSVTIPDTVLAIENNPFGGCRSLTKIEVAAGNPNYCSVDGVLFSKDMTKLIAYPAAKAGASYTIPSTVTTIGERAFLSSQNLTSVTIPSSVVNIEAIAFSQFAAGMMDYYSVVHTERPAPGQYTYGLKDVYYAGTETQWKAISNESSNDFIAVTMHYGNTTPTTPTQPEQPTTPAGTKTANPTNDKLAVNGAAQTPTVYKIGGSNYFKIRDVAAVLNGTEKQFSVGYSGGKVTVASGQPYASNGKELKGAPTSSKSATRSNDTIIINGAETDVTVYKIGGSNYFKLRDLGKALDFYVGYSGGQVSIDTSRSYGE